MHGRLVSAPSAALRELPWKIAPSTQLVIVRVDATRVIVSAELRGEKGDSERRPPDFVG
jgi:hypothetical protein